MEGSKKIFGMGNPLLDISAEVPESFLEKYGFEHDKAILAEEKHLPVYDDMKAAFNCDFIAGGATQNTIRVAQWMSQVAGTTHYFGSIANDDNGNKLKDAVLKDGVSANYHLDDQAPTGTCAVLVTKDRALIANIAAANNYKIQHLEDNWSTVESCDIFYIAGFFLTVSPDAILKVGKYAHENKKVFAMNISAPFLIQFFKDPMMQALPYCDYIFGNETEALTFSETHEFGTKDIKEIALKIAAMTSIDDKKRHVVITQGKEPTIIAYDGKIQEFPVEVLPAEKLVDTNGAGDSFVGGFLAYLAKGADLQKCVEAGHYASRVIIQRSGCTFPETAPEF